MPTTIANTVTVINNEILCVILYTILSLPFSVVWYESVRNTLQHWVSYYLHKVKTYYAVYITRCATIGCMIFMLFLTGCYSDECFEASDYGKGTKITIFANNNEQHEDLLLVHPLSSQVSKWIDTGYSVNGSYADYTGDIVTAPIKMEITGSWLPWGSGGKKCNFRDCCNNASSSKCGNQKDLVCLDKSNSSGFKVSPGKVVTSDSIPCYLDGGVGLYGLIAEFDQSLGQRTATFADPNVNAATAGNPLLASNGKFHTFYIPIYKDQNTSNSFTVDKIPDCSQGKQGTNCAYSTKPQQALVGGRLFFKLVDNYYYDNVGSYQITLLEGVYKEGIVSKILSTIQTSFSTISQSIFVSVVQNGQIRSVIKVCLVLYLCFIAVSYMLGIAGEETAAEITKTVFKISVISILLYDAANAYQIYYRYLISWFSDVGNWFADLLAQSLFAAQRAPDRSALFITGPVGYMSMYDQLINQMLSPAIHAKIHATLLTWHFFYWFFLLYVLVLMLIISVLRAVSLYIVATFQLTILILLLPIVMVFAIFKKTYKIFSTWLTSAASSALLIILVTAVSALMVALMNEQLADLFYYKVCGGVIWRILDWDILSFWKLDSKSQTREALMMSTYLKCILIYAIFDVYIKSVPRLADTLASSMVSASAATYETAVRTFTQFQAAGEKQINDTVDAYRKWRNDQFKTKDYTMKLDKDGKAYVAQSRLSKVLHGGIGDGLLKETEQDGMVKKIFRSALNQISLSLPVKIIKGVGSLTKHLEAGMQKFDDAMSNNHNDVIDVDFGLNTKMTKLRNKLQQRAATLTMRKQIMQQKMQKAQEALLKAQESKRGNSTQSTNTKQESSTQPESIKQESSVQPESIKKENATESVALDPTKELEKQQVEKEPEKEPEKEHANSAVVNPDDVTKPN